MSFIKSFNSFILIFDINMEVIFDLDLDLDLNRLLNQCFPMASINQLHKDLTILTKNVLCEQPCTGAGRSHLKNKSHWPLSTEQNAGNHQTLKRFGILVFLLGI